jgi:hypothetical protein
MESQDGERTSIQQLPDDGSRYASLIFSQVATSWNWITLSTALLM